MTNEERKKAIEVLDDMKVKFDIPKAAKTQNDRNWALDVAIQALSQEPCEDIAQERYKDLCEYFGGAKDILKSREDFKAWLGRVKWHIHKAEELYEKYEYKKEPCDDAISREAALEKMADYVASGYADSAEDFEEYSRIICQLPPVTQKSGKWIEHPEIETSTPEYLMFYECSECGDKQCFCKSDIHKKRFCSNCGACMKDGRTLDEFIEDSKESEDEE